MTSPQRIEPDDTEAISRAMTEAVASAVEIHRRLKQPIVRMSEEGVVWIAPEDIEPRDLPGDGAPLPQAS